MGDAQQVADGEACDEDGKPGDQHHDASPGDRIESQKKAGEWQGRAEILLQKEEQEREGDTDQYRQKVFERRHVDVLRQARKLRPGLARVPENFPARRKVSGEEQDQQNANDLDRLKSKEVDL